MQVFNTSQIDRYFEERAGRKATTEAFRRGLHGQSITPAIAESIHMAECYHEGLKERSQMLAEPDSFEEESLRRQAWIVLDKRFVSVEKALRALGMDPGYTELAAI